MKQMKFRTAALSALAAFVLGAALLAPAFSQGQPPANATAAPADAAAPLPPVIDPAIIDAVAVKKLSELTPRELDRESPELRTHEELAKFLSVIYDRPVLPEHTITIVHFSPVTE